MLGKAENVAKEEDALKPPRLILQAIGKELQKSSLSEDELTQLSEQTGQALRQMKRQGDLWPSYSEINGLNKQIETMLENEALEPDETAQELKNIIAEALPIARGFQIYQSKYYTVAAFRSASIKRFAEGDTPEQMKVVESTCRLFNLCALKSFTESMVAQGREMAAEQRAIKALEKVTAAEGQTESMERFSISGDLTGPLHAGRIFNLHVRDTQAPPQNVQFYVPGPNQIPRAYMPDPETLKTVLGTATPAEAAPEPK